MDTCVQLEKRASTVLWSRVSCAFAILEGGTGHRRELPCQSLGNTAHRLSDTTKPDQTEGFAGQF